MPKNFRRFSSNNSRPNQGAKKTYGRGRGYYGNRSRAGAARGGYSKSPDYSQYIRPAKEAKSEEAFRPEHKFSDFPLADILKKNLSLIGFETPTQIQDLAIPLGLAGKDVIGIANTGTGKTAAFGLPLLTKLIHDKSSRALIVAPTRELAEQIEQEFRSFASGSGIAGSLLIGGQPMGPQLKQLRLTPQVVIGTPGRILDHIKRGTLKLRGFKTIVLDEVDRMCDMGFLPDIKLILSHMSEGKQSLFFSATITPQIEGLITSFMNSPEIIKIKSAKTSDNVDQNIVKFSGSSHKVELLHDILIKDDVAKTIIFSQTKRDTEKLTIELNQRGFKAESIHGDKNQPARKRALAKFKQNHVNILVATDVAARGIDVTDITHVINFDLPGSFDDYIHRIGRTGRAGKKGYALTFVPGH